MNNGTWTVYGTTSSTHYDITGLSPSTTYSFKVRALSLGEKTLYSPYSSTVSAKTSAAPTAPSAPTNVKAENTSGSTSYSIKVSWSSVSGAAGYEVSMNDGSWRVINTTTANYYNMTGLSPATTYSFRIRAYTLSGSDKVYSSYSSTASKSRLGAASSTHQGQEQQEAQEQHCSHCHTLPSHQAST